MTFPVESFLGFSKKVICLFFSTKQEFEFGSKSHEFENWISSKVSWVELYEGLNEFELNFMSPNEVKFAFEIEFEFEFHPNFDPELVF